MRCRYCFYADVSALREFPSYGLMTEETTKRIIDQIYLDLEDGDHLALAFQGGEPTLAGLAYFEKLMAYLSSQIKEIHLTFSIQTNGLLLDDSWAVFLKKNNFLVGLSIDGYPSIHDVNRLDVNGHTTYERVQKAKRLLDTYQVPVNILTVLTRRMAENPDEVMDYLLKNNIDYVQFIPCLPGLENQDEDLHALTPELFASFYDRISERWLEVRKEGRYLHIQLFDAIIELLMTGKELICGLKGRCHLQNIVEADGSVYPCDFYVLDCYKMGNLTNSKLSILKEARAAQSFLREPCDMAKLCMKCPYAKICLGGCKRMKNTMYLNDAEDFCGYQLFMEHHYTTFRLIAQQIVNN